MRRIMLTVCYDGTDFCGWQKQTGKRSVQQTIEDAVFAVTGERVTVTASGRTDAGVHAKGQTCDFATASDMPADRFAIALSVKLPCDVKVLTSREVGIGFDSRRNAKKKTYVYTMYEGRISVPLYDRYAVMIPKTDLDKMKKAVKEIEGEHDFKCFCATGSTKLRSTVRTVYECKVDRTGDFITITVTGSGFLYNMVRIIAGATVFAGLGKITPEDIAEAIKTGDRKKLGKTMPAKGLTLMKVEYDKTL